MQYELILQPEAIQEIEIAHEWYEHQKMNLGQAFIEELELSLAKIEKYPHQYGFANKWVRKVKLNKFPFNIIFEVEEDKIYVYSVLHTSKKPRF
jgi:toxin ParE1/3/4